MCIILLAMVTKENMNFRSLAMRLGILIGILSVAVFPLSAGTLFSGTIDPAQATAISAGNSYTAGVTLNITVTSPVPVNLLGASGDTYITNPDGSIAALGSGCGGCFGAQYVYVNQNATYPIVGGHGDGINHFQGGGANYDLLNPSPFATEGKPTTDTTDPGAIRFGAIAYTFIASPSATDWHVLVGANGIGTISGANNLGGTLKLVVVDTFYSNNTGSYFVTISDPAVPEPSTVLLALSGVALLGFVRRRRAQ